MYSPSLDHLEQSASGAPASRATWTLAAEFQRCARLWPTRPAADDGSSALSFGELDKKVDDIARRLQRAGVAPGDRVLLLGGKDVLALAALLAISRAGAVFVPVTAKLPEARLRFYLEDAAPRAVLGREALASVVGALLGDRAPFISLESLQRPEPEQDTSLVEPVVAADDVAYVIYTSGSTGYPKGVQIEQRNIEAFFLAHNARVGIRPGDRCMNTGPLHFDVAIMDVLLPLLMGATVYLTSETPIPSLLLATLERHRITHFYAVGTVLALMTGDGSSLGRYDLTALRVLQTGAEVCNPQVVNAWLRRLPHVQLLNSYGPTEVTVGCISWLKPNADPLPVSDVPIGLPHAGTIVALLGDDSKLIRGSGETGELLLGGLQVMRGYLNRPLENMRVFVEFEGQRYYRSGDFAWRDDEGNLHYVGRRDDEVKINGQRIHLNEIRRCIAAHPEVRAAAVGVIENERGNKKLACIAVSASEPSGALLRRLSEHFAQSLTHALSPSVLALASEIPQLPSGKSDERRVLASLQGAVREFGGELFLGTPAQFSPLSLCPLPESPPPSSER